MSDTSKTPLITDEQIQAAAAHTDCVWLLKQYSVSLREFAKGLAALVAEQLAEVQARRNASNREVERLRDELEAAKRRVAKLEDLRQEYMGIIEQQAAELDARDLRDLVIAAQGGAEQPMRNERCAHEVCDEEGDHDASCTVWRAEQPQEPPNK